MAFSLAFSGKKPIGYLLLGLGILLILILAFVKLNYDAQAAFLCENIEASGGDMLACPAHKTDASWLFMTGFGVSLVIAFSGLYAGFIEKPILKTEKSFQPLDPTQLDSDSRRVYDLLRNANGSLFQSDLIRETGFSKVKLSRLLDKLEQGGLVERRRRGMANLVVLH